MLPQPFILQLPGELYEQIFTEGGLSRQDLKSLRLTCRSLAVVARHALSLTLITVSRLRADRDVFEQIARNPWRAKYVEEIIWEDLLDFDYIQLDMMSQVTPEFQLLMDAARDEQLFWAPKTPIMSGGNLFVFPRTQTYDSSWLVEGIQHMRNLKTITVRPMRGWRILPSRVGEIPAAQYGSSPWGISEYNSLGLMMIRRVLNQPECNVRTLNLSIDVQDAENLPDTRIFQYLTTIDICVFVRTEDAVVHGLLQALEDARNVRELKLRFREDSPLMRLCVCIDDLLFDADWPSLHSLHLAGVSIVHPLTGSSSIANVGHRLRHITLDECRVTYEILDQLREEQAFPRLQSFIIRSAGCEEDEEVAVDEMAVLAFLRNEIEELRSTEDSSFLEHSDILYTEILETEHPSSNPFYCRHLYRCPSVLE